MGGTPRAERVLFGDPGRRHTVVGAPSRHEWPLHLCPHRPETWQESFLVYLEVHTVLFIRFTSGYWINSGFVTYH